MPIRIFLADDHAVLRDSLRLLLGGQSDFSVVGDAGDGIEALRLIRQLRPDVALVDIGMPGRSGIAVTEQIREDLIATRVVILSMYSDPDHVGRALQAGAQGYVLKASAGREVVDAVRAVYAGRRYLSQHVAETVTDEYLRLREATPPQDPLAGLSVREREILRLVVEGYSSAAIAGILHLSPKSVETYRKRMMAKVEVHDIIGLVKFAIRHGITPLE